MKKRKTPTSCLPHTLNIVFHTKFNFVALEYFPKAHTLIVILF